MKQLSPRDSYSDTGQWMRGKKPRRPREATYSESPPCDAGDQGTPRHEKFNAKAPMFSPPMRMEPVLYQPSHISPYASPIESPRCGMEYCPPPNFPPQPPPYDPELAMYGGSPYGFCCELDGRYQEPSELCISQQEPQDRGIKAVVENKGYISLHLRYDVHVDIAPNQAIRITNHRKGITLVLSGCATQMALVHPQGRVLQYNSRIEVQTEDFLSIKNAKMWPRGVSFTANNCALVYLVDQAGARSTTDTFHDLYADNAADTIFLKSCQMSSDHPSQAIAKSIRELEVADYWRTDQELDCWMINEVRVKQTPDGLVTVDRKHGRELFTLQTSPGNGKAKLESSFVYVTASMGDESHIFVRSNDRRLHYNGNAFVVRNAGHAAGFDEHGILRIW